MSNLLVLSDVRDSGRTDAVVIDQTTGAILTHIATPSVLPYGAAGDTVASGQFALTQQIGRNVSTQVNAVNVYNAVYTLLLSIPMTSITGGASTNPNAPLKSNGVDKWYLAIQTTPSVVHELTASGLTGNTWTPTAHGGPIRWMAVSRTAGNVTLYYTETGTKPIYRWDLTNDVALASFVTNDGTDFFEDLSCLATGDVLSLMQENSSNDNYQVNRYDAGGSLQATYAIGDAQLYELPILFLDYSDSTSFWVKAFTDATGATATYFHIRISDGATLASFVVDQSTVDDDGKVPSTCAELLVPFTVGVGYRWVARVASERPPHRIMRVRRR